MEYLQGVTAYILSPKAEEHIQWMKDVLGGVEKFMFRSEQDDNKVAHAVVAINGGCLFITDVSCDKAVKALNPADASVENGGELSAAASDRPCGFILHLEVEDPDRIWEKAMSSGCSVEMELKEQCWGGYYGAFKDPFGFPWAIVKTSEENRKRGVVPYILTPKGECSKQIEWLKAVYGGEEKEKWLSDDGSAVKHCTIYLNGYTIYLADQVKGELESLHGKPRYFHCHLDVPDAKEVWEKALKNDAKTIVDLKEQFWGGLQGTLEDKFGCRWSVSPPYSGGPTNSPGVVAYLLSPNCQQHIDFVKKVFDGKVKAMHHSSDKKVMHCSMEVNGGELCLCDQLCNGENADWPEKGEACGFMCHLDLSDPDAIWKKAMENGCTQVMELKKQFWGDYYGVFKDPLGYGWSLRKET